MNKEDLMCLIGKYLNGYKIVKIEDDLFIKGQINLFTDEWECEAFNDRYLVKFYVRNEDNNSKFYKELVNKENYKLKQALNEIRKIISECKMLMPHEFDYDEQGDNILQIIDEVLGDDKDE